jgi:hypothetical protein
MTGKARIHLTEAQKAKVDSAASKPKEASDAPNLEEDLTLTSWKKATTGNETATSESADPGNPAALSDSTDLTGSGADLTGSGKRRPTAVIRLL